MIINKYSHYEYEVYTNDGEPTHWFYRIYKPDYKPSKDTLLIESKEWFDSEGEAGLAAIGHIDLLEKGQQ